MNDDIWGVVLKDCGNARAVMTCKCFRRVIDNLGTDAKEHIIAQDLIRRKGSKMTLSQFSYFLPGQSMSQTHRAYRMCKCVWNECADELCEEAATHIVFWAMEFSDTDLLVRLYRKFGKPTWAIVACEFSIDILRTLMDHVGAELVYPIVSICVRLAAARNDQVMSRFLSEFRVNPDAFSTDPISLCCLAIERSDWCMLKFFIHRISVQKPIDERLKDMSILMYPAIACRNVDIVSFLAKDVHVHCTSTALLAATSYEARSVDIRNMIIDLSCAQSDADSTLITLCRRHGRAHAIQYLLTKHRPQRLNQALNVAACHSDEQTVTLLVRSGAMHVDMAMESCCQHSKGVTVAKMIHLLIRLGATDMNRALRAAACNHNMYAVYHIVTTYGATDLNSALRICCASDRGTVNEICSMIKFFVELLGANDVDGALAHAVRNKQSNTVISAITQYMREKDRLPDIVAENSDYKTLRRILMAGLLNTSQVEMTLMSLIRSQKVKMVRYVLAYLDRPPRESEIVESTSGSIGVFSFLTRTSGRAACTHGILSAVLANGTPKHAGILIRHFQEHGCEFPESGVQIPTGRGWKRISCMLKSNATCDTDNRKTPETHTSTPD